MEDLSRLLTDSDRTFKKKLDEEALHQQHRHVEALERALKQHEAVRKSAEQTYETFQLEIERQRIAREAAQARKLAEERRKLEEAKEAEIARIEDARQKELARLRDQERQQQEREQARKRQQEEEEAQNRARQQAEQERIAAEKRAQEQAASQEAAARAARNQERQREQQQEKEREQQATRAAQPASTQQQGVPVVPAQPLSSNIPAGLGTTQAERLQVHNTYLQLHAQCKALRKEIMQIKSTNRSIYDSIRDHARHVKLAVGQLAKNDPTGNRKRVSNPPSWEYQYHVLTSTVSDSNYSRALDMVDFMLSQRNRRHQSLQAAGSTAFASSQGIFVHGQSYSQNHYQAAGI